jgi:hypothetical protein
MLVDRLERVRHFENLSDLGNEHRPQASMGAKIGNVLHFADSFVCQSALRIFFFGFRCSVLNQIDTHDCWAPFALNASFTFA